MFTLLLDTDRDAASGCSELTADGAVAGIEVRLRTTIDLVGQEVSAVSWAECLLPASSGFGPETPVTRGATPPWSVSYGNGTSGSTLLETYLPLSAVPNASIVDAFVAFDGPAGSDALISNSGLPLPTGIPLQLRPAHVPSLSTEGLLLLVLAFALATGVAARRTRLRAALIGLLFVAGVSSPLLVRAGLGDGILFAWESSQQVASDLEADAPEGVDMLSLFAMRSDPDDALYLRLDVLLGPAVCLSWGTVDPGTNFACNQEPPPDPPPFGNLVAMTFDDGPSLLTTPSILATLRAENVPATFFVKGNRLETAAEQALALEIHNDPLFRIANHSYSHPRFTTISLQEAETQISTTSALIRAAIDDPCYFPRYFRFPFGASNCDTVEIVREHGMTVTGVNINTVDWCYASGNGFCSPASVPWLQEQYRDDMIGWILAATQQKNGGIMLLHDIHAHTAQNLPALITQLRAIGVSFVDLDSVQTFPLLNAEIHEPEPPACCNGVVN